MEDVTRPKATPLPPGVVVCGRVTLVNSWKLELEGKLLQAPANNSIFSFSTLFSIPLAVVARAGHYSHWTHVESSAVTNEEFSKAFGTSDDGVILHNER